MDQIKIGKFIAECRKQNNLTQMQLAERLGITDRAVSKWETGKSLPDSSIMLDLCKELKITVNDLLSGEVITMENYNKELENKILEMVRQKEESDKRLLRIEVVIGVVSMVYLLAIIGVACLMPMEEWLQYTLIFGSLLVFLVTMCFCLKIEQVAGYYECKKCGHKYVPTYMAVNLAMHMGRTRYLKCPECGKKSWQRKVISKQ